MYMPATSKMSSGLHLHTHASLLSSNKLMSERIHVGRIECMRVPQNVDRILLSSPSLIQQTPEVFDKRTLHMDRVYGQEPSQSTTLWQEP